LPVRTRHIALNAFLHRIRVVEDPYCTHCERGAEETIRHFLFDCPAWGRSRRVMVRETGRHAESLAYLLNEERGVRSLMKFINATGRFRGTYGELGRVKYSA
ncbi:hypothetical protein CONPUDRAFT_50829, partial [Coniophora puteana RWD-64-598 SS2]